MNTIHERWYKPRMPLPSKPDPDPEPEPKTVHRCRVCKREFTPTVHHRHQILCGDPECRAARHRIAKRRHEAKRATQIPVDHPVSMHTGVRWRDRPTPWYAQIKVNGKVIHLGSYATEAEAADAFRLAAAERKTGEPR